MLLLLSLLIGKYNIKFWQYEESVYHEYKSLMKFDFFYGSIQSDLCHF
jgi:hypothetical protein